MRKQRLLKEKRICLVLSIVALIVMLLASQVIDPPIEFADPRLENAIYNKLKKPLTKSNLLLITELDASDRGIKSLEGIENLRKLVSIDLSDNHVEDLTPLATLDMLSELSLRNNQITDLGAVNFEELLHLPLRKLSLRHNVVRLPGGEQIRLSDISLLKHLKNLEELELRDNHIADISALSELVGLKELDLRKNNITNIEPLRFLNNLEKLNLRDNDLSSLAALEGMQNLTYLNIRSNENIDSVKPIAELVNLEELIMRNVPVGEEVHFLLKLTNLQRLNVRNCSLNDLEAIVRLMNSGALQDNPETGLLAEVDIRNNNLYVRSFDPYEQMRQYWVNVTYRYPADLNARLSPPVFSHVGGFSEEEFILELSTDVPGATIYYTLDGSEPDPGNIDGKTYQYKNSYPFEPGDPFGELLTRSYKTNIYSGLIQLLNIPDGSDSIAFINTITTVEPIIPTGEVFRGTVVRAAVFKNGYQPSPIVTNSYFIGEGIKERYHVPVISVVTAEPNLFDYETGIYVAGRAFDDCRSENPSDSLPSYAIPGNYFFRGREWEKEVNLEFFSPHYEVRLNQLAGLRVHGGTTRAMLNKSLRFYARSEYDNNLFNIKLFDDRDEDEYKRFILRNSGDDSKSTMFRDALMQGLVRDVELDCQAYQPSVLFINGIYWGLFNIRERVDRFYLAQHYGVDPEKVDLLESNTVAREGNTEHYVAMLNYIEKNDLSDAKVYDQVSTMMDINNFINYMITQIYNAKTDWPGPNILYWRLQTESYDPSAPYGHDGRWRWIVVDNDSGFGLFEGPEAYMHDTLSFATAEGAELPIPDWPNPDWSTFLLRNLLKNDQFKVDFINRFADHLNTIFLPEVVIGQIDAMQDNLAPLIQEHIDRYSGYRSFYSIENWNDNVQMLRVFAQHRPEALRGHIIDFFGLEGIAEINLSTNYAEGTVIINTVDTSLYVSETGVQTIWTGQYFIGVPVTIIAVPKEGYRFDGWVEIEDDSQNIILNPTGEVTLTALFSTIK